MYRGEKKKRKRRPPPAAYSCQGWHLIKGEGESSALGDDINQRVTFQKGHIVQMSQNHVIFT